MRLGELSARQAGILARQAGLGLSLGPFTVRLGVDYPPLVEQLRAFYADTEVPERHGIADFHVRMRRPRGPRRWIHPQIDFFIDGERPFEPYPLTQALPLFEWGLNWCIATRSQQFLMLHAAVLERGGRALILPATPGSGKSTLCAALAHRDWRLLSDEFGLVRPETGLLWPLPRAIPLKNVSIEVIRRQIQEARLGPLFPGTRKGDVAHVQPPPDSLARQHEPATPGWLVFPTFRAGAAPLLTPIPKSLAFIRLSRNSFNYQLQGAGAFRTLAAMVRRCPCYSLQYGSLDQAMDLIGQVSASEGDSGG